MCQALETQGKDNQENWLSLCVSIYIDNYDDMLERISFRLSAGKRKLCIMI